MQGNATIQLYGHHNIRISGVPDWHSDPINGEGSIAATLDWVDALKSIGTRDIKHFWELSRFYWLPQFAVEAKQGNAEAEQRIELWLSDWIEKNPPHFGINWTCGQEASIRLMNLALVALILDSWNKPSSALKWLIEAHAKRIYPTLSYALGQDNNHGTAEAIGLFIAGSWGKTWSMPKASKYSRIGRRWMNNRAKRMIQVDGSPAQYSTTYHRVNLELLCLAELWSQRTGIKGLSLSSKKRIVEGAHWLFSVIDAARGDAPNMGANDGSSLFNVTANEYRDFRPTVSLAAAMFDDSRPWRNYDDPRLDALNIVPSKNYWATASSRTSKTGGFHILRCKDSLAVMNYPSFKFRPCQADLLHVDLWHKGINLLRDAGTFSYSAPSANWFASTAAHNTVEFNSRDQMPRLGKFLFGHWLKADYLLDVKMDGDMVQAGSGYKVSGKTRHQRDISLQKDNFTCVDKISGPFETAVLRWRLAPGEWIFEKGGLRSGSTKIHIEVDGQTVEPILEQTKESRLYALKNAIPVASVQLNSAATVTTKVSF